MEEEEAEWARSARSRLGPRIPEKVSKGGVWRGLGGGEVWAVGVRAMQQAVNGTGVEGRRGTGGGRGEGRSSRVVKVGEEGVGGGVVRVVLFPSEIGCAGGRCDSSAGNRAGSARFAETVWVWLRRASAVGSVASPLPLGLVRRSPWSPTSFPHLPAPRLLLMQPRFGLLETLHPATCCATPFRRSR